MKIKIIVHRDLCQSAATCVAVAPAAYALDDEFKAIVVDKNAQKTGNDDSYELDVSEDELKRFTEGAKACPYKAIEIIDEQGKKIYPR